MLFVGLPHNVKHFDFVWLLLFVGKCYVSSTDAQKYGGERFSARYVLCDHHCASRRLLDGRVRLRSPCNTNLQKLYGTFVLFSLGLTSSTCSLYV